MGRRSAFSDTITVSVGTEEHCFNVHKDIICAQSPFFKAACSGAWKEAQDGTVRLKDCKPYCFMMYLARLYNPHADLPDLIHACRSETSVTPHATFVMRPQHRGVHYTLSELWVLGDFLGDVPFKNGIMDSLHCADGKMKKKLMAATATFVLDNTSPQSTIMRWVIDRTVPLLSRLSLEAMSKRMPHRLISELLKASVERQRSGDATAQEMGAGRCKYHEHKDGSKMCT